MGPNMARDKLRRKYPHAYYAGIVSLLKVVRWDTVQRGAIDRPYTPDEIMGELEKRVDKLTQEFEPLPALSGFWIDNPVTLPPGCERLATRPLPTGSPAIATIGMEVVACFNVAMAAPYVKMTWTFCCTSSAAISATRSGRPSDQR